MSQKRSRTLFTGGTLSEASRDAFAEARLEPVVAPRDLDETGLQAALADCEAYVMAGLEKVTEQVLRSAPRLRAIAFLGVGYSSFIDTAMATRLGIPVTNAPRANTLAVAEFTLALALEATRRAGQMAMQVRQGAWPELTHRGLISRTVGIVGSGAVGSMFAYMAHAAFGCRIIYTNRSPKAALEESTGAERMELRALLQQADLVSLHLALTPETEGVMGPAEFAAMKRGAALICTGRSELIQPRALRRALETGQLGCAAMDGYYQEPAALERDAHGLLGLENMFVTPHVAYLTDSALDVALRMNLSSINNILRDGTDQFLVNPDYAAF